LICVSFHLTEQNQVWISYLTVWIKVKKALLCFLITEVKR